MKTMKKFLTVLLTAVTVFSLAACGSKKTEETAAETKAAEKTAAESGEATEAARRAEAVFWKPIWQAKRPRGQETGFRMWILRQEM